jgi:epoxyqueuosine reductase
VISNSEEIPFSLIKSQAMSLGWDDVGITDAIIPQEDIDAYLEWIARGYHGDLGYMENQIRCSPQELFPSAQSAIMFISHYKQPRADYQKGKGLIASYARGRDYHNIHRKRLKKFIAWLEDVSGQKGIAKGFSDSTPILEKALAIQAGLGWLGKNTLLIHRRFGTFFLLSGILTSLKLTPTPSKLDLRLPRCGSCTRCLDSCPTQALIAPYTLDARRCLSYHLIESKKPIPEEISKNNPGYIFGCDICQNVCPHNVRPAESETSDFAPDSGMGTYLTLESVEDILKQPEQLYGTPLQRRGAQGLLANLESLKLYSAEP